MKTGYILKNALAFLLVLGLVLPLLQPMMVVMAQTEVTEGHIITQQEYAGEYFRVRYSVINEWLGKRQIEVSISNLSEEAIRNWGITYEGTGAIENVWNAVAETSDSDIYKFKNAGYNICINPGETISFGYIEMTECYDIPSEIRLMQETRAITEEYQVIYNVTNEWNGGFQGDILIVNKSNRDFECWELSLDSNILIQNMWGADYLIDGNRVTLKAFSYNPTLKAGETITIGFLGSKEEDAEIMFSNYELTNIVHSAQNIAGIVENPTIEENIPMEEPTTVEPTVTEEPTTVEQTANSEEMDYTLDSDGDGLPDVYEIYLFGTDPLLKDSDGNGVEDGEEDLDSDGINNLYEYTHGMSSMSSDSDFDGISDYDEIYVYGTDPTLPDSDGDGIKDGDEVKLGLNPALIDSNGDGIGDGEVLIKQEKSIAFRDSAVKKASVTMECNGCIDSTTTIKDMLDIDILSSHVVGLIGNPIDIHTDSKFEEAVITFYYDKEKLGDTKEEDLAIMWYDEDNNAYVVLEDSVVDINEGTVSYKTTHFSTYLVVDSKQWYELWKNAPDYTGITSPYTDLIVVTDYTLETELISDVNNSFYKAKQIVGELKSKLEYDNNEAKDRSLFLCYPYDGQNYELSSRKSSAVAQYSEMKPAQTMDELDRIDLIQDGKLNEEYFIEDFDWNHYIRPLPYYNTLRKEQYLKGVAEGKYFLYSAYAGAALEEREGMLLNRYPNFTCIIPLKKHLDNCALIGMNAYVKRSYGNQFTVGVYQIEQSREYEVGMITDFCPEGEDYREVTGVANGAAYVHADALIFDNLAKSLVLKDVWVQGYFKESMAEKGILTALDAFENAEDIGNKRRLIYMTASDSNPIPEELLERAKALNVKIDVVYFRETDSFDNYNMAALSKETGGESYCGLRVHQIENTLYRQRPEEPENMADYDGDGIPDVYEIAGLYMSNGQIVYTDPTLTDTDGDGISDGAEIGINGKMKTSDMVKVSVIQKLWSGNFKNKYAFRMVSNPTLIDSDGDGYLDGIDNEYVKDKKYATEADKTPLKCSVIITALKNEMENGQYVPVIYEGSEYTDNRSGYKRTPEDPNYGGSQMWAFDKTVALNGMETKERNQYIQKITYGEYINYCLENAGCGGIAVLDNNLYMTHFNDEYMKYYMNDELEKEYGTAMQVADEGSKYVPYEQYLKMFTQETARMVYWPTITRGETPIGIPYFGVLGELNKNRKNEYKYDFVTFADEKVNEKISEQLGQNVPVILLIMHFKTIFTGDKSIYLREYAEDHISQINQNDVDPSKNMLHYMTITKVIQDNQMGKIFYCVSSWGGKYLVDMDDILEYLNGKYLLERQDTSYWSTGVYIGNISD